MTEWIAPLSAIVASLVSGAGVWYQRRQTMAAASEHEATAADVTVGTALELLEPLRLRVRTLEEKLDLLCAEIKAERAENADMREGVELLSAQLVDAGHKPGWP